MRLPVMLGTPAPRLAAPLLVVSFVSIFSWGTKFDLISRDLQSFWSAIGDIDAHSQTQLTITADRDLSTSTNQTAFDHVAQLQKEEERRGNRISSMLRADVESSSTEETIKLSNNVSVLNFNITSKTVDPRNDAQERINRQADAEDREWINNMVASLRRERQTTVESPTTSEVKEDEVVEKGDLADTAPVMTDALDSSLQRNETDTRSNVAADAFALIPQDEGNLSWIETRNVPFRHWSISSRSNDSILDGVLNESAAPLQNWSNIAFVHVGKSAGSTLSLLLRKGCRTNQRPRNRVCPGRENLPNETIISHKVSAYFHAPRPPVDVDAHDKFLFVVRNPLDRIISEFYYSHPQNQKSTGYTLIQPFRAPHSRFYSCFKTIQQVADNLRVDQNEYTNFFVKNSRERCNAYAWWAVLGKQKVTHHMYYNYFRYAMELLRRMKKNDGLAKEILVVRTEHIWDDWQTINTLLGGGEIAVPSEKDGGRTRDHGDLLIANNKTLTPKARFQLCRALRPEYEIYKQLLDLAMNLNETDVETSVKEFRETCPPLNRTLGAGE